MLNDQPYWVELAAWLLGLRLALSVVGLAIAQRVKNGKPVNVRVFGKELLYVGNHELRSAAPKEKQSAADELLAQSGYSRRKTDEST
jgi:hypothetical protein